MCKCVLRVYGSYCVSVCVADADVGWRSTEPNTLPEGSRNGRDDLHIVSVLYVGVRLCVCVCVCRVMKYTVVYQTLSAAEGTVCVYHPPHTHTHIQRIGYT